MHYISKIIAKDLDMKNIKVYFYSRNNAIVTPFEI